ncbi:MAG: rod-binding protein, partial [Burkholderiaceae bacterium]|nr:rod-binding protein [Burkholderiaceae bacterium]
MALSASNLAGSLGSSTGTDTRSIEALRSAAARDPKNSIRETAKQFESLFMQEVMKSMRASTMATGMLDNPGTQMGTEMLDTQFAGKLTGLPGGLSDAIARQLQRQMGVSDKADAAKTLQPLP